MAVEIDIHPQSNGVVDRTDWARENLPFLDARGELVYLKEWRDSKSSAVGWLARWGDPEVNVSGGGVRMKIGGQPHEAVFLASTMYEKFGIAGPQINGSKFVIDYDPTAPDKLDVLDRFLTAFLLDLENVGTAGDLNVSESEVAGVLGRHGIGNPQQGILKSLGIEGNLGRLTQLMRMPFSESFSPKHSHLMDVTAGWSTYIATETYFRKMGMDLHGRTIAIQGIGAVGGSAAYFFEKAGARVVAAADAQGSFRIGPGGLTSCLRNIDTVTGCVPREKGLEVAGDSQAILQIPVDVLVLAAKSEVVGLEEARCIQAPLIVEGANHPILRDAEKYLTQRGVKVLPDFIANAGTAEFFTIGMLGSEELSEQGVLDQVAQITINAMTETIETADNSGLTYRQAAQIVSTNNLWQKVVR